MRIRPRTTTRTAEGSTLGFAVEAVRAVKTNITTNPIAFKTGLEGGIGRSYTGWLDAILGTILLRMGSLTTVSTRPTNSLSRGVVGPTSTAEAT